MYAIKLTNTFQDAYNQQHKDGLLSAYDCDSTEENLAIGANVQTFETKEAAQEVADTLSFNDNPDLEVVEYKNEK